MRSRGPRGYSDRLLATRCFVMLALFGSAASAADPQTGVRLEVSPLEATVGDRLSVRLLIQLPPGTRLEPVELGPELGPFSVISGAWERNPDAEGAAGWIWSGELAAFRTGELEIPAISVHIDGPDGRSTLRSEPLKVEIKSVLDEDQEEQPAELKPPVSVPPDYRVLWVALAILGLLLVGSLLFWWLHRRYGARFAAAEVPHDPFHRTPPHEWVYAELQRLLELRLPEQGKLDEFYSELSRILKTYLGGRFRVPLLERTTAELSVLLAQVVGAEDVTAHDATSVLANCDEVKFAQGKPGPTEWKAAVETIYRIVDATKPVEAGQTASAGGGA